MKKNQKVFTGQLLVFVASFLFCFSAIFGQGASGGEDPLFRTDDLLNIELSYDINALNSDKGDKRSYHPAKLVYTDAMGRAVTMNVRVRVRGKFRRTQLRCKVPNFRIKFDKTKTAGTLFAGQGNLKVVAHCKSTPKDFPIYTFLEYYIYKTYQIFSDLHYKVRLVRITYIDIKKKGKTFRQYGFLLENSKRMAKRLKIKRVEAKSQLLGLIDPAAANVAAIFQFMIGNSDWSFRAGHNMVLVTPVNQTRRFPIPYDFDQTGLVDPVYAKVDERLNIKTVRDRLFRGFNKDLKVFERTFKIFRQHKEAIYDIYRNSSHLPENHKKRIIKYLEGFYKIINNPKLVRRYFIKNYRGRPFPKR